MPELNTDATAPLINIEPANTDLSPQIWDWLRAQTQELAGDASSTNLQFAAHDESGTVVGGATGALSFGLLQVHLLATSPAHRRQGLGARLLRALETQAISQGATCAVVDTLEWEAPDFYQKQGYQMLGVAGDQIGRRRFFLVKQLVP